MSRVSGVYLFQYIDYKKGKKFRKENGMIFIIPSAIFLQLRTLGNEKNEMSLFGISER